LFVGIWCCSYLDLDDLNLLLARLRIALAADGSIVFNEPVFLSDDPYKAEQRQAEVGQQMVVRNLSTYYYFFERHGFEVKHELRVLDGATDPLANFVLTIAPKAKSHSAKMKDLFKQPKAQKKLKKRTLNERGPNPTLDLGGTSKAARYR